MQRPHLTLLWNKNKIDKANYSIKPFQKKYFFNISFNKKTFDFKKLEIDKKIIYIFGVLIKDNIIQNNFFLNEFNKINDFNIKKIKKLLEELNGQFLIIIFDKKLKKLHIINDRFNSFPIYYSNFKNKFLISHLYFDIFKENKKEKGFKINKNGIKEFLWFRRTFGNTTYDNFTKFLLPASLLTVDKQKITVNKYWIPKFKRKIKNNKFVTNKFIQLLNNSSNRLSSDNKKNSIFLSAGHDSRIVLASFKKKPISFSFGFSKNFEVKVANKIAKNQNSKFKFIKLEKNHFVKNLNYICKISGGQYSFYDGLFAGVKNKIKNCDVIFHGHGLDYLFAGLYSPNSNYKIFNSPIFFEYSNLKKNTDLIEYFINNVKFRTKGIHLEEYFIDNKIKNIKNNFRKKLNNILTSYSNSNTELIDKWDYLIIDTLGKHYSKLNLLTMQTYAPQRTLVFDNDIFDFYLSLHPKNYKNLKLLINTINRYNKNLGNIPTSNYGLAAGDNALIKTIKLILRKIKRIITKNRKYIAPLAKDKTFPDREIYFKNNIQLKNEIIKIFKDNKFKRELDFIDWNLLENKFESWDREKIKNEKPAQFLFNLLSIYKLFKLS